MNAPVPQLPDVQRAILAVIAAAPDGITAPEVAQHLKRNPRGMHRPVSSLEDNGCIAVLTIRKRVGSAVKVWGVTTTGRRVLAALEQQEAAK